MSGDTLAAEQARKEIKEEHGPNAKISEYASDFLAKIHYYQSNPEKLEEVTGKKIPTEVPSVADELESSVEAKVESDADIS
jgi:hypothetical protein